MREILFRGKRLSDGAWIVGNLFVPDSYDANTQICMGTPTIRISANIDPDTVGQFTGLYDKNGKPIFEGDIVEFESHGYIPSIERGEVVFNNGCFCIKWYTDVSLEYGWDGYFHQIGKTSEWQDMGASGTITYTYEIIGNIHDNPE